MCSEEQKNQRISYINDINKLCYLMLIPVITNCISEFSNDIMQVLINDSYTINIPYDKLITNIETSKNTFSRVILAFNKYILYLHIYVIKQINYTIF